MFFNDWISDLISRIKIGLLSKKSYVIVKNTKMSFKILRILYHDGWIANFKVLKNNPYEIQVYLKYYNNISIIKNIKKISKSSRKVYLTAKEIRSHYKRSYIIFSSSQLGLSSYTADNHFHKLYGGEIILSINQYIY